MTKKFDNVPDDKDTVITFSAQIMYNGNIEILYQKFSWDGISGECLVFSDDDIAHMSVEELQKDVKNTPIVNSDSTVIITQKGHGFTFATFNCTTE